MMNAPQTSLGSEILSLESANLKDYTAYCRLDAVTIVDDPRNYFIESNYRKTLSVQQV